MMPFGYIACNFTLTIGGVNDQNQFAVTDFLLSL
jgi:hypothetical protein